MIERLGKYHNKDAAFFFNPKVSGQLARNNLTLRNIAIAECNLPSPRHSTTWQALNLKSLRLFRTICRLIPFLLRIHEIPHRVTPIQSCTAIANRFRKNAVVESILEGDNYADGAYEDLNDAEFHFSDSLEHVHQVIAPVLMRRDLGKNRYFSEMEKRRGKKPKTKFLSDFYRGGKTHQL